MKTLARFALLGLIAIAFAAAADDATKPNPNSSWGAGIDEPGCSFIEGTNAKLPRRTCRQDCCAIHDKCYKENHCTAPSWFPTIEDFLIMGGAPWLGYGGAMTAAQILNPAAAQQLANTQPGSGNDTMECRGCNNDVAACWTASTIGLPCLNLCTDGKEACYDRLCDSYYCSTDCYDPLTDVCEQQWGDARCNAAQALGYGVGYTRYGMHGGALLNCVPYCYNLAAASGQLPNAGLTLCAANYEEDNPKALAVGWISSLVGGSICCYCGTDAKGLPSADPAWPYPNDNSPVHSGGEGDHGAKAGCPSGCPCSSPNSPCYDINGCWNDSHMCAQAVCGQAVGMCCG